MVRLARTGRGPVSCHHSVTVSTWRDAPARENLVTQLIAFRAQSCNQHSNLPHGQLSIAVPIKILTLISILHKFYLHSRSCNQWTVILYMSMGSWCHLWFIFSNDLPRDFQRISSKYAQASHGHSFTVSQRTKAPHRSFYRPMYLPSCAFGEYLTREQQMVSWLIKQFCWASRKKMRSVLLQKEKRIGINSQLT